MSRHAIGLDFGTLSARAIVVDVDSGESTVFTSEYEHGILEDPNRPDVARQNADDYLASCQCVLKQAAGVAGEFIGIGIGATASTPIPAGKSLIPLSRSHEDNLDAHAWLWKDHSSQKEADEITSFFAKTNPALIARVGAYYAEWFWAKALQCARKSPDIFDAAETWVEQCDFVSATLTGNLIRGSCAAGHKALYHRGYPTAKVMTHVAPRLGRLAETLPQETAPCNAMAGGLTEEWSEKTGLPKGLPVAVGGVDAHLGAVGAGVTPGSVCLVLGTSACHIAVAPYEAGIHSVPGVSGIADDSVLPGMLGLEAGQAAFGDLFEWTAAQLGEDIEALSKQAMNTPAGSNGLLVLDFHAGNRCPYADARLSGVMLGQTLATTKAEIFRAHLEAAAIGIRQILDLFRSAGVPVSKLITCGGVAQKNPQVLQIIADVTGMTVARSSSEEASALGAAIFGAVVGDAFETAADAQDKLCRHDLVVHPVESSDTFDPLYSLWKQAQKTFAHDSMLLKDLLDLRDATR